MSAASASASASASSVRGRIERWAELKNLLNRLDAMVAANAHIDGLTRSRMSVVEEVASFERDMERVRNTVNREVTRLTVDALRADLIKAKEKKR